MRIKGKRHTRYFKQEVQLLKEKRQCRDLTYLCRAFKKDSVNEITK